MSKRRKLKDREIEEIIDVKRGRLTLDTGDEKIEFIKTNLLKPPP